MMKAFVGLYAVLCITNSWTVSGQKTVTGTCTQFGRTQLPVFNMLSYMGLWYTQGRYDYASTPELADCMTTFYRKTSWGHADIIERSKILTTNTPHQIDSKMICDRPTRGHYTYEIPADGVTGWPVDILATDYISYSIEFSCLPNGNSVDTYIWVLSRTRYVDNLYNARISKILRSHNIDESSIRKINQNLAVCS